MTRIRIGATVVLLFITSLLAAQESALSLLEENLEQLSTENDAEPDWEEELETLALLQQEPLNINTATRQQWEQFPFLTDIQIENLLAYIHLHGQMQSIHELQLVAEMDRSTLERLRPFVCVQAVETSPQYPSLKTLLKYGRHELLTRLDLPLYTRKGYEDAYLGTSSYHSLRYRFHYGDYLQLGVTAEKDAGEPMFALHNRKGYDSYSPYLIIKTPGRLRTLALGNYRLSLGQGLVLSTDFRLGKSTSLSTTERRTTGIRKHSSTDEYNYLRGAAATVSILPMLQVSAFYSNRSMEGVTEAGKITSIYKSGLHRTQQEADKRHAFSLQLAGGNLTYDRNRLKVGLTGIYYTFSRPYEPDFRKYQQYNLHGSRFYNLGIDYRYRLGRFVWTGEAATGRRGYALLNQLRYHLSPRYRLLLVHRYYTHDYWAFFGRSFGESSTPQNENGWYLAAEATPWEGWNFFASADFFAFPWWRYRISKASQGMDLRFRAAYAPQPHLSMYLSYRYKQKERDVTGTAGAYISPTHHHSLRYRIGYAPGAFALRTTLDYNHFRQQDIAKYRFARRQGWQCTQLCSYTPPRFPLSVAVQGTYFHTDDYDSRVYASEKGLLYTFYTPSFYGSGFRYSAHLRYDAGQTLMLLVKWGQTLYQDRETIGSGNDLIAGNKKTDVQMQLRIKF